MTAFAEITDLDLQSLPISQLAPSAANPRKSLDPAALAQLAESVKRSGVNTPLTVRPVVDEDVEFRHYEIVCGHRRFEAAKLAGLEELPCLVRELDDDEAAELAVVDNLQREDVPPLEEAEAYGALLERAGSIQAVALQVGKPLDYVARRLKLRELGSSAKEALGLGLIGLDHALLLAKLGPEEREKALRYALDKDATQRQTTADLIAEAVKRRAERRLGYGYWEPQSPLALKRFVERELKLELRRAPWDLADASLVPEAGACKGCPQNTAANTALFGDLAVEDATCANAICFEAKREAFVRIVWRTEGVKARVSWKPAATKPKFTDGSTPAPDLSRVLKLGQWIEVDAKKKCGKEIAAVAVDFGGERAERNEEGGWETLERKPGEILSVCVAAGCKVHPKAWERAARPVSGGGKRDWAAEERERREAYVEREMPIREAVYRALVESGKANHASLFASLLLEEINNCGYKAWVAERRGAKVGNWNSEGLAKAMLADAANHDAWALDLLLADSIHPCSYLHNDSKRDRAELWEYAKRFGVDADKIAAQFEKGAAADVVPKPKRAEKGGRGESPEPERGAAGKARRAASSEAKPSPAAAAKSRWAKLPKPGKAAPKQAGAAKKRGAGR